MSILKISNSFGYYTEKKLKARVILVRGCKRARQVKTYLKTNAIKPSYPNSSIPPSLMLKEK
jgi:hypothetical protein